MPTVKIRTGGRKDLPSVLALVRKLAEFEKLKPPSPSAIARFRKHGFGKNPYFHMLIVESQGKAIGYAFYFFTYSTFLAKPTLYLEDLFVLPEHRRAGVGEKVLRALARVAKKKGCGRMEWCVLDWNKNAIRFYNKLGAKHLKEWYFYRLALPGIQKLAKN